MRTTNHKRQRKLQPPAVDILNLAPRTTPAASLVPTGTHGLLRHRRRPRPRPSPPPSAAAARSMARAGTPTRRRRLPLSVPPPRRGAGRGRPTLRVAAPSPSSPVVDGIPGRREDAPPVSPRHGAAALPSWSSPARPVPPPRRGPPQDPNRWRTRVLVSRRSTVYSKTVPLWTTMSENFRLNFKMHVTGRYWLSSSFKFQWMCQVSRRETFSETCLLLCTCSSMIMGGTAVAKSLAFVTHRQTCQLTDHRSSLHQRFSPSAIWRSEECQRDPLDPFPIHFIS